MTLIYATMNLLDATWRFSTLLEATRRYSTLLDATRRYSTLLDATRRCSTLLDATRRYSTLLVASRRYSTLLDATRRYSTLLYIKQKSFCVLLISRQILFYIFLFFGVSLLILCDVLNGTTDQWIRSLTTKKTRKKTHLFAKLYKARWESQVPAGVSNR
jgi:hypothetical protein